MFDGDSPRLNAELVNRSSAESEISSLCGDKFERLSDGTGTIPRKNKKRRQTRGA